jgi:hypothetical protein
VCSRVAVALAVQVEDGLLRQIFGVEILGGGEIIDRREFPDHGAGAHHQRIEIGGQHAADITVLHQLGDGDVRPIDMGLVDGVGHQIPAVAVAQLRHHVWIGLRLRPPIGRVALFPDTVHEAAGQWDSGGHGTTRPDQQAARSFARAQAVGDFLNAGVGNPAHRIRSAALTNSTYQGFARQKKQNRM